MLNKKYLQRQGEPEAHQVPKLLANRQWEHFIAIPSCGEHLLLPRLLESLHQARKKTTLVLILVNEGADTSDSYKTSNRLSIEYIHQNFPGVDLSSFPSISLREGPSYQLLLVERTGLQQFPKKAGVGLARKICADIGLSLFEAGQIKSPWIHNTDADAQIPADYFKQTQNLSGSSAAILHRYRHETSGLKTLDQHWNAAVLYECWLRYYVLGLRYGGSPYAFPSIGSTISINPIAYSQALGFPKRQAGEDFYLLNKLRKLGKITRLKGSPIRLQDRLSARVPFGTGQGTQKIQEILAAGSQYMVYHPHCFFKLKIYLDSIMEAFESNKPWQRPSDLNFLADSQVEKTSLAMEQSKRQCSKTSQYFEQFSQWFDGFRTLKFIHACRDQLGSVNLAQALDIANFWHHPPATNTYNLLNLLRQEDEG